MKEIQKGKHELSTHIEITGITYHLDANEQIDMIDIQYKEGQIKNEKLITIGNYNKRILKLDEPIKGISTDYDKELAEYEEVNTKLDDFSTAKDKIKWAEDEI